MQWNYITNEMSPEKKQSKIEFISDLLNDKNIGISEKDRLFSLIAKELQNYDDNDVLLFDEIKRIKQHIGLITNETTFKDKKTSSQEINNLPDYIDPKENTTFLKDYNQNLILKSTTHLIDSNLLKSLNDYLKIKQYNFDLHLAAIQKEFRNLNSKHFGKTSPGLAPKISAYLTGYKPWSENNLQISWGSKELKIWANEHLGQCPNPGVDINYDAFAFERIRLKNGGYLKNMCDLVLFFKKQVTIRLDNNLLDLCKEWSFDFRDKVEIDYEELTKNIEFFTDTEKLNQAFRRLVYLCIEVSQGVKPRIRLSLKQFNDNGYNKIAFSIHHLNSTFGKTIENTLMRYGTTFTDLIKNQINGLCNFKLRANFGDNRFAHLSLWPRVSDYETIGDFKGVEYLLIFNY